MVVDLVEIASAPDEAAIFLDFDGVLAPIVSRPEDAAVPADTHAELERLARKYALVAVVSGRSGEDVRARVGVLGIAIVGTHGLELDPEAEAWRPAIARFAESAVWPRDRVELKGLSVVFHFRDAADEEAAVRAADAIAERARDEGLAPRYGRKVLEVLPPTGSHKGTAVHALLAERGLSRALVAGDDTTDIDAFRAIDDLPVAVRVAVVSDESPEVLREAADVVVHGPGGFLELLRLL